MSLKLFILFFVISLVKGNSIIQGIVDDTSLKKVYNFKTEAYAIPLLKRSDDIHYDIHYEYGPIANQQIKGIAIKELGDGSAHAEITRGGVGYSFVDIYLESARGSGYIYSVEIFA